MGKSSYSTKIAMGALALMGYLGNVNSAEAQQSMRQNRILSRNEENSATGEGVLLKDFAYKMNFAPNTKVNNIINNLGLVPNTKVSLDSAFGLYAQKGEVSYNVVGGREGLRSVLSTLRKNKNPDGKEKASIHYIEGLLRNTSPSDTASVGALERAVRDKVIDVGREAKNVVSGRYVFIAKSKAMEGYEANSIPIIVDIKNSSYSHSHKYVEAVPSAKITAKKNVPAKTQSSKDNAAKEKALRENLALERHKLDSLNQVSAERALRQAYLTDSTKKAIARDNAIKAKQYSDSVSDAKAKAREQFVRDSVEKIKTVAKENSRKKFVADSTTNANKPRTRFGVEASYGSNSEGLVGAFLEVPLNSSVSIEGFGDYFVSSGKAKTNVRTDTTLRERELIGPGTYKQRTDEITTTSEDEAIVDVGLGLLLKAGNVRFNFRGGVGMSSQDGTIDGKSTIAFERNMAPLGQPETITNSMPGKKKNLTEALFSAGAMYDFNKNLSLGVSFNGVGKRSGGRINFRYRF